MGSNISHCPGENSVLSSAARIIFNVNSWAPGKFLGILNSWHSSLLKRWLLLTAFEMQSTATILSVLSELLLSLRRSNEKLPRRNFLDRIEGGKGLKFPLVTRQGAQDSRQEKGRRGRTSVTLNRNFSLLSLCVILNQCISLAHDDSLRFGFFSCVENGFLQSVHSCYILKACKTFNEEGNGTSRFINIFWMSIITWQCNL